VTSSGRSFRRADRARVARRLRPPGDRGWITLENVAFGYDPAVPVLEDVNLSIRAGECVSLSAHRSREVDDREARTRFYDPTEVAAHHGYPLTE